MGLLTFAKAQHILEGHYSYTRTSAQQDVTHNNKKAAHGRACEADWDYLAYSEPEARLFLVSSYLHSFVVVCVMPLKQRLVLSNLCRPNRTATPCYDTTNHHCLPKTKGRRRGHGRSHHGTRG